MKRVLGHAELYHGLVRWKDILIQNILDNPACTLDEVESIQLRLLANKQRSYGPHKHWLFRARLWRVRRVYEISHRGCRCHGVGRGRPDGAKRGDRRIGYLELTRRVKQALSAIVDAPDRFRAALQAFSDASSVARRTLAEHREGLERKLERQGRTRRNALWQHEQGYTTDAEQAQRIRALEAERFGIEHEFAVLKAPPELDLVQSLLESDNWHGAIGAALLYGVDILNEEALAELADKLGLKVYLKRDRSVSLSLWWSPVLQVEGDEARLVTPTSGNCAIPRPPAPGPAWRAPVP